MMEWYKRYRPQTFQEVIGQSAVVQVIQKFLQEKRVPQAILFHGPSGCGKTTLARILAKELGCEDFDLKEMNSSNYRGIDTVRELIRNSGLAPVGPCRVYILDEVHKLTNDAQNAMLKILEDSPKHVYFLLCTTDPERLLRAVRTRCTPFACRSLPFYQLKRLARRVLRKEGVEIDESVVEEAIERADGSARVLLVLLEKAASVPPNQRMMVVQDSIASSEDPHVLKLARALMAPSISSHKCVWKTIRELLKKVEGDPEGVRWAVLGYARKVLLNSKKPDAHAAFVIDQFSDPFYDSKEAGLARACYMVATAWD